MAFIRPGYNGGGKRQSIDIIADNVQFLGGGRDDAPPGGGGFTPRADVPVDSSDFATAGAPVSSGPTAPSTDDIPF